MSGQLGDLVVSLSADIARFREDLGKAQKLAMDSSTSMSKAFSSVETAVGSIGKAFVAATAVMAGGAMFKDMISTTKTVMGEVTKLSKVFGVSAEQASVMRVALDDAFLTVDDAVGASDRLTRASIKNAATFEKLGINIKDSDGNLKDSLTIMAEVNTYLLTLKEGKERDTAAMALYGKGWRDLSGILRLTASGMEEAKTRAKELHLVFGSDGQKSVKEYKLAMKDIEDVSESLKVQIGMSLIPALTQLATAFGDAGTAGVDNFGNLLSGSLKNLEISGAGIRRFMEKFKAEIRNPAAYLTASGREELQAELDAIDSMYEFTMRKISAKYGGLTTPIVKARKPDAEGGRAPDLGGAKEADWTAAHSKYLDYMKAYEENKAAIVKAGNDYELQVNKHAYDMGLIDYTTYSTKKQNLTLRTIEAEQDAKFKAVEAAQNQLDNLSPVTDKDGNRLLDKEAEHRHAALLKLEQARKELNATNASWRMEILKGKQDDETAKREMERKVSDVKISTPDIFGNTDKYAQQTESERRAIEDAKHNEELITAIKAKGVADRKALMMQDGMNAASLMASQLGQVAGMMNKENRSQFETWKKLATAQAIISTTLSAIEAYKATVGVPVVGPFIAPGFAATAIGIGMAQVAQIQSTQFQGREKGGPVTSGTTYLVGEKGPELFTPGASGQITSNDRLGKLGGSTSVTNVYQISTGVSDTVRAEIGRMIPMITNHTLGAVTRAINGGTQLSAAVGRM